MIRKRWRQSRLNCWSWLERLEEIMVHHMIQLKQQRDLNDKQGAVNKTTNTLLAAQTTVINQLHARLSRLETLQFGYGPPSRDPADPLRGKEHC